MSGRLSLLLLLLGSFLVVSWDEFVHAEPLPAAVMLEQPVVVSIPHLIPPQINEIAFEGNYVWLATYNGAIRWNKLDGSHTTFTTQDGLADDHVLTIMVEPNGVKWFGTANGLSRFDGLNWTTYTTAHGLPGNHVRVVWRHPDGSLFVGTIGGLVRFDGATFSRLPYDGVDDYSPGTYGTADVLLHDGVLWIGTSNAGTYRFDGDEWLLPLADGAVGPGGSVNDMALAPDGAIWFAFDNAFQYGSVGRMVGETWTRYTTANGLIGDSANAIAVSPSGQVYAAFGGDAFGYGGLSRFNGSAWAPMLLDGEAGIPASIPVYDLKFDANGTMWVAVYNMLLSYDGVDWQIHLMGPPTGTPAYAAGVDLQGNMWFGVLRTGAVKFDGQNWRLYTGRDGMNAYSVQEIIADSRGDVWFSTRDQTRGTGVRRFDGAIWRSYSYDSGLGSNTVRGMAADDVGNVWFATDDGLARFDGASWKRYTMADGLETDRLIDVAVDGGDVWVTYFGGAYGLTHFDGVSWETFREEDGLPNSEPQLLAFDSAGNLWATSASYLSRFDGVSWTNYPNPLESNARSLYIDPADNIWTALFDLDELAHTGLTHFKDGVWTTFTTADGLPTNQVDFIAPGPLPNQFWTGSAPQAGVAELRLYFGLDEKMYLPLNMNQ